MQQTQIPFLVKCIKCSTDEHKHPDILLSTDLIKKNCLKYSVARNVISDDSYVNKV